MGGQIKLRSLQQPRWSNSVEAVFASLILGTGLLETVVFLLGTSQGNVPISFKVIGALYFVLPYVLLQTHIRFARGVLWRSPWRWNLLVLALNVLFLTALLWYGTVSANIILAIIIAAGLLYNAPKIHFRTVPVLDVLCAITYISGPFLYGVFVAGNSGSWWIAGWLTGCVIVAAHYFMRKLPAVGLEARERLDGTVVRLGMDRSISIALGLYITALFLPIIGYGWHGVPVSVALLWYVVIALQAVPLRLVAGTTGLRRVWRAIWFVSYPITALILAYAAVALAHIP
ncbi:MAG TPA: hypothetical protein VLG16_01425 [Candidatus Saccharimonadales bacterium]|nr:hypothetical protein [Candidatus Saccharimonadales bacterium]